MDYILEVKNLRKNIKKQEVLRDISLRIPSGITYGLLGPNGAGKSTFMKVISGLMEPTGGEINFCNTRLSRKTMKEIGVLIEAPALYGNLTAMENMIIHAKMKGVLRSEIEVNLRRLGMDKTGKKRVSHFSLGMKQRLGIAIALLGKPKFLILDEPTNGLDPMGIQELRELLKKLNEEGMTILISSHNLFEIQQISSHIGIIVNGKLKFEGENTVTNNLEEIFMKVSAEERN